MYQQPNPSHRPPMPKKRKGNAAVACLALLLVAVLVAGGFAIRSISQKATDYARQIESQRENLNQLSKENQTAHSTVQQQQSQIGALESTIDQQSDSLTSYEQAISGYKDKISSYKDQVSDLTSRYNDLVETKKEPSVPKYATVAVSEKTCYLTFDDGPSENTLKVLDILKRYNVKATFFVIGTSKLSYVKRIHEEGHTVALHSYSHEYSDIYRSQKAYFADLKKIGDAVKKYTGEESKVIRFPGGSSNTVSKDYCKGIMTALSKETLDQGYVYFDWNVDSTDASGNNVAVSKILNNIKTYGGHSKQDVVLMHDTDAKDTTVEALPKIIEYYIDKGYTFAPLTTSTPMVTHGINN